MVNLDGVGSWYSDALEIHGRTPNALGWRDEEQQDLRFDRLLSVLGRPSQLGTVLDYGCGYGSLLTYLIGRDVGIREYVGVDISSTQLEEAAKTVANCDVPSRLLETSSPSESCDYVFVSGTFNLRQGIDEAEWAQFVRQTIKSLWGQARSGLAMNFLTTNVDWRRPDLFYLNPASLLSQVLGELTSQVIVDHSYPLYEWSIGLHR